jgi:hypothetical protein
MRDSIQILAIHISHPHHRLYPPVCSIAVLCNAFFTLYSLCWCCQSGRMLPSELSIIHDSLYSCHSEAKFTTFTANQAYLNFYLAQSEDNFSQRQQNLKYSPQQRVDFSSWFYATIIFAELVQQLRQYLGESGGQPAKLLLPPFLLSFSRCCVTVVKCLLPFPFFTLQATSFFYTLLCFGPHN